MNRIAFIVCVLALPGCATFSKQPVALQRAEIDALGCGAAAVQTELQQLTPSVIDALAGDSPDWNAQLAKLASTGINALTCAIGHALFDALGAGAAERVAGLGIERAVERHLRYADAGGSVVAHTPTRRILARGLWWLRGYGYATRLRPPAQHAPP